ncbi:MAG: SRPBCC family protein [Lachnospirales bacterium]
MARSRVKAIFQCEVKKVWEVVTSLENYEWRSDLSKIEIVNDKTFIEYTKEGYQTTFTMTQREPFARWEFDMDNDNMHGHWIGVFTARDGMTEIDFTEEVTAKKLLLKPFVKGYLKKQQERYITDLKKALQ